jgi:hypothetical protein
MDDGQQNGFFCFLHDPGSTSAAARRHRLWILVWAARHGTQGSCSLAGHRDMEKFDEGFDLAKKGAES